MQTKPVRSLGADITQATLQQTLDQLDISTQVAQLNYAEKRLLIMISLTKQLSGVTNDWGRTLNLRQYIEMYIENFVNVCKNGVNIIKQIIFANGKDLLYN